MGEQGKHLSAEQHEVLKEVVQVCGDMVTTINRIQNNGEGLAGHGASGVAYGEQLFDHIIDQMLVLGLMVSTDLLPDTPLENGEQRMHERYRRLKARLRHVTPAQLGQAYTWVME